MLTVSSWKPLDRVTNRVAGGLAVTCGALALGTASATSASAQASPDDDPTCPICVIQFDIVTTVGSLDGPSWIPGRPRSAARDSRGRLYLTFSRTDHVLVFDSTGQPLPPIGRSGEGPGEYQTAYLVEVGASDSVMVFDFTNQLSFVTPSGEFVRRVRVPVDAADMVLTGTGRVVFSESPPATPDEDAVAEMLHVFDPAEAVVEHSFHVLKNERGRWPRFYLAEAREPDRLWANPSNRFDATQFATDGTLTRHITRSPSWIRPLPSEDGFPAPNASIYGISETDGRLWIVGQHPVEDWNRYLNWEISRELEADTQGIDEAKLYRSVVEVVDIETGRLVTNASVPGLVVTLLPDQHVATYREDEAGVPFVDVFRMTVSRPPGDDWSSAASGTSSSRVRASCS